MFKVREYDHFFSTLQKVIQTNILENGGVNSAEKNNHFRQDLIPIKRIYQHLLIYKALWFSYACWCLTVFFPKEKKNPPNMCVKMLMILKRCEKGLGQSWSFRFRIKSLFWQILLRERAASLWKCTQKVKIRVATHEIYFTLCQYEIVMEESRKTEKS